jgi:hypothetical protein
MRNLEGYQSIERNARRQINVFSARGLATPQIDARLAAEMRLQTHRRIDA